MMPFYSKTFSKLSYAYCLIALIAIFSNVDAAISDNLPSTDDNTEIKLINNSDQYSIFLMTFLGQFRFDKVTGLIKPGDSFIIPKNYFCNRVEQCNQTYLIHIAGTAKGNYSN